MILSKSFLATWEKQNFSVLRLNVFSSFTISKSTQSKIVKFLWNNFIFGVFLPSSIPIFVSFADMKWNSYSHIKKSLSLYLFFFFQACYLLFNRHFFFFLLTSTWYLFINSCSFPRSNPNADQAQCCLIPAFKQERTFSTLAHKHSLYKKKRTIFSKNCWLFAFYDRERILLLIIEIC